ncbi:hypothetical protein D3C85_1356530 [compost metagenome]
MVARGVYGLEHRVIGLRTVLQQVDLVAGRERTTDQGLLDRQVQVEDIGFHAGTLEPVEDGLAALFRQWAVGAVDLHRGGWRMHHVGVDMGQRGAAQEERGIERHQDTRHCP